MMNKIRYRLVWNRANKLRKGRKALVQIECLLNGKRLFFSTKVYLKPEQWDGGKVVEHPHATELNSYLYNSVLKIEKIELDFITRGIEPTLMQIKNAVLHHINRFANFSEFVTEVVENSAHRGEKTRASYQTLIKHVENFQKGVTLQDIDLDFLNRFVVWSKKQGMSQSTISGRLKNLRAIINEAIARKLMTTDDDPFRCFKIKKISNRTEFLRWDEVKKLEELELTSRREKKIRDAALFALYTGLRFSDLNTLTSDNLIKDGGKVWLVKTPEKTKNTSNVVVNLPLYSLFDGKPLKLIRKYKTVEKLTHIGNNASANRTLKDIMKKVGISEDRHITFHTLRHSFASLLISRGVPITSVQKLCGHTKIEMTLKYSHLTVDVIKGDVERAFKKKKTE